MVSGMGFKEGKDFEREAIFTNGDRFILCDVVIKRPNGSCIAIELDGSVHSKQEAYDRGRDKWLLERWGIRTVRFSNHAVLHETEAVKHQVMELLNV